MKSILISLYTLLLLFTVFPLIAQHKHEHHEHLNYVTNEVQVKGKIKNEMILTANSLQSMKVVNGKDVKIVCQSGEEKKKILDFKGVLLKDIIDSAGVIMNNKKDRGKFIIMVTASDGYKVAFTYNELFFGEAGNSTYVCFEENGMEIKEEGRIIIFCTSDKVSGPRHVKWVKEINVKEIE